jgi:hypothetical protein
MVELHFTMPVHQDAPNPFFFFSKPVQTSLSSTTTRELLCMLAPSSPTSRKCGHY